MEMGDAYDEPNFHAPWHDVDKDESSKLEVSRKYGRRVFKRRQVTSLAKLPPNPSTDGTIDKVRDSYRLSASEHAIGSSKDQLVILEVNNYSDSYYADTGRTFFLWEAYELP